MLFPCKPALSEKGLTLNKQKCEFSTSKLDFYGFTFSASGISAQHKKLEDIKNLQRPSSATEVRSLLGLANYCSRLIKDFSTITHPLRELTRKGAKFEWTPECEKALLDLKRSLTSDETLGYFDPNNHTELIVDASPVGLGAILTQSDITSGSSKIIAYASRALSDVEKRYSQTEREALAIVWGCEHFHLYLFGMQHTFTLVTDHKPLQLILNNPSSKPPARIERWSLRLQPYNFSVVYRSGITNPADYMSRHPANPSCACDDVEEYINLITHSAIPNALSLAEVAEATKNDPTLQKVIAVVRSNNWKSLAKDDDCDVKKYLQLKNELTVSNDDIILKNNKIVLPNSLRKQAIDLAHVGHQGIVKTTQLIREKVWFPGIDKFVESLVKDCIYCQAAVLSPAAEPLNMTPLPNAVWSHLSVDFSGPYSPNNDYLLVIVDEYSRFPVVETVHSTKSSCVIPVLEKVFSLFSIPDVVKSDNGPPFNGSEFAKFAKRLGFKHRKIMPLWPQSNSVAERFMRTLNKAVRISNAEQCSWKCDLHEFLRNYRATPHCSINTSPAELLFNRKMKTTLPQMPSTERDSALRNADHNAKQKTYSDARNRAKPMSLHCGDLVLLKCKKENKLSLPYDPKPYKVIKICHSMITAQRGNRVVTRNITFFKRISDECKAQPLDDHSDDEEEESWIEPSLFSDVGDSRLEVANLGEIIVNDSSYVKLIEKVNEEIRSVSKWMNANKLTINMTKSNILVISPKLNKFCFYNSSNYPTTSIPIITTARYLGIILDDKLSFQPHIKLLEGKLSRSLGILRKVKPFLSTSCMLQLYYSFFHSHLQYGILLWGSTSKTYLSKIKVLQNKAIKVIGGGKWRDRATPFYKKLKILKIVDIYKLETAIFMYKYRTNKLPAGMNNLFQETSQVHTKCTRTANLNNYFIPFYRTNRLQNSIQYQGAKLWNSIDPKIRNLKSLNQFKTNYKFLLLNDY